MADQPTIDSYNKSAKEYRATRDQNFWESQIEIFKKYLPSGKVLDIGCGTGRDTPFLLASGFEYQGIDASESMLACAREDNPSASYALMDFEKLSFEKESFDGFWAAAAILHVRKENTLAVLNGFNAILKKKGIGFISIKPRQNIEEGYIEQSKWGSVKRFFSFYSQEEFIQLLSRAGFSILETGNLVEEDGTNWLTFFVQKHD